MRSSVKRWSRLLLAQSLVATLVLAPDPQVAQASTETFDIPVAASSDDAEESETGSMSLTSGDLELVNDGPDGDQVVGIRFVDLAVPRGARVDAAYVQFTVDEPSSVATSLTIAVEAVDNAQTFESGNGDISSRPRGAEEVVWDPPDWVDYGDAGVDQRTPDLSPLIQEIVDRPGWASGNSIALIITGTGLREAESFDGGFAPSLHLEITHPVSVTATDPVATEGSSPPDQGQFILTRSGPTDIPLTVDYSVGGTATADVDYTGLPGSVTIPAGEAAVWVDVVPLPDTETEGVESVVITVLDGVGYVSGSPGSAEVTIADGDLPEVSVSAPDSLATEGADPADEGQFVLTRTGLRDEALTVTYAVAGSAINGVDYSLLDGSATIPAGQGSVTVALQPLDDAETETAETVVMTVLNSPDHVASSPTSAMGYVIDNEVILDRRVATSAGDAEESQTGTVDINDSSLEIVTDQADVQTVGLRFGDMQIPQGSVVTAAWIRFQAAAVSLGSSTITIEADASDSAPEFSESGFDVSSRARTAGFAVWSPPDWDIKNVAGGPQTTPDLSHIVQEMVNRPGWNPGNGIAFVLTGDGTRIAEAFDSDPAASALLHVEYVGSGAPSNQPPSVRASADSTFHPEPALLGGTVNDDSLPDPGVPTVVSWSVLEGPGTVTFDDANSVETTATFSQPGVYRLRLSASDGDLVSHDDVQVTAVDPASPPPETVRAIAFGDYGSGCCGEADVAALVSTLAPDFIITTGDNRYVNDMDWSVGQFYDDFVGNYQGSFGSGSPLNRFFPSVGNHDYSEFGGIDVYLDYFTLPGGGLQTTGTSGNEHYYDFVQGPVHFFVINSDYREADGNTAGSVQANWLEAQLGASTSPWQVVYMHHAPYSSGSVHGSNSTLQWPYEAWGADAVLSGHDHTYERLTIGSIPYFVVGTGGAGLYGMAPSPLRESEFFYNDDHGALLIEACPARVQFEFHSVSAGVIDSHAIGAPDCANAPPVASDDSYSTSQGVPFDVTAPGLLENDFDADGDGLTIVSHTQPANGSVTINADGSFSFAPDLGFDGVDVFTYVASDGQADSNAATVTITVDPTAGSSPSAIQESFRIRSDDSEALNSASDWAGVLNEDAPVYSDEPFRIRFEILEQPGDSSADSYRLQYRSGLGPWSDVPIYDPLNRIATPAVAIVPSSSFADQDPTVDLLPGAALPFTAGVGDTDNDTGVVALDGQHTELEWTLVIRKFFDGPGHNADGSAWEFRVIAGSGEPLAQYANTPLVTLLHRPGHIGGTFIEGPGRSVGPFADSNGNLYLVIEPADTDSEMIMVKSEDGGQTWLAVDNSSNPSQGDLESVDIRQVGSTLHIAHSKGGDVYLHNFRTSDDGLNPDTWGVTDQLIDVYGANVEDSVALEVFSDGSMIALYEMTSGGRERIGYRHRDQTGTWDSSTSVLDSESGVDWSHVMATLGSGDLVYIFYLDATNGNAYYRTIGPSGSPSARTLVANDASVGGGGLQQSLVGLRAWSGDGVEKILFAWRQESDGHIATRTFSSGTGLGPVLSLSDAPAIESSVDSRQTPAFAVVDGALAYLMYGQAVDSDLYVDRGVGGEGWGIDTEIGDGLTVQWLRGEVFTHSPSNGGQRVIGYVFDNGSNGGVGRIEYADYVLPVNSPPVGMDDSYSVAEDSVLNVAAPGVLGNDSDPDGDALVVVGNTQPSDGSVTLNSDGSFAYTPDPDFFGSDSFTYDVSDGVVTSTATVTVTVTGVNDLPVADAGVDLVGAVGVVVVLDGSGSFDVDGDPLSYAWVITSVPGGSTAALDDPTVVSPRFTPDVAGDYVVELVVNDGQADSLSDSVTVTASGTSVVQFALSEQTLQGSATGDLSMTQASDGVFEELVEEHSGGRPQNRQSFLEHRWSFDIQRGDRVVLGMEAFHSVNSEYDDFAVEVSTDGGLSFQWVFNVTATGSPILYEADLPAVTSGEIIVRVVDEDRTIGNGATDSLFVDFLAIETVNPQAPLAEVTVAASDPSALEGDAADPGAFTVSRSDPVGSLTVFYTVEGSATPDADYQSLSGSVVIANGTLDAVVTVSSIDDSLVEGDESVELVLSIGADYRLGMPSSATVVIADDDVSGSEFRAVTESTVYGRVVSGDHTSTHFADGSFEVIDEELYAGQKRSRLEHQWTFITTGSNLSFHLVGDRQGPVNEGVSFGYSTDGSSWSPMSVSLNGTAQTFVLPSTVTGTIYVRVIDDDRNRNEGTIDTIRIDEMFLQSSG